MYLLFSIVNVTHTFQGSTVQKPKVIFLVINLFYETNVLFLYFFHKKMVTLVISFFLLICLELFDMFPEFTREVTDTQMPLVAPVILPEMYKIFTMAEVHFIVLYMTYNHLCSLILKILFHLPSRDQVHHISYMYIYV